MVSTPSTGGFRLQRVCNVGVFVVISLGKLLNKQSSCLWFEPSPSCDVNAMHTKTYNGFVTISNDLQIFFRHSYSYMILHLRGLNCGNKLTSLWRHQRKHFPRYWSFVRGIHWLPWIPLTKASDAELWCFLWSAPEQTSRKQSRRRWFEMPSRSLWRHCNVQGTV